MHEWRACRYLVGIRQRREPIPPKSLFSAGKAAWIDRGNIRPAEILDKPCGSFFSRSAAAILEFQSQGLKRGGNRLFLPQRTRRSNFRKLKSKIGVEADHDSVIRVALDGFAEGPDAARRYKHMALVKFVIFRCNQSGLSGYTRRVYFFIGHLSGSSVS
jgi:hypothetical protein